VPAIDAAARVLRYLAEQGDDAGVSDIGRACHLSKSSAHAIVKALELHGFVAVAPHAKRYTLGAGVVQLAEAFRHQRAAVQLARPALADVARRTRLACFLAVPYSVRDFLILEKAESAHAIKVTVAVGERFPLTAGALGKAYLAWLPEAQVRAILKMVPPARGIVRPLPATQTYLDELRRVRRQGFGANYGEYYAGTHALSAPVFDASGRVVLLLLTVGLADDLPAARMTEHGRLLRAAADRVTAAVGGHRPDGAESNSRPAGAARTGKRGARSPG
jgi:DNA-binding IclR family transcriptional regulator